MQLSTMLYLGGTVVPNLFGQIGKLRCRLGKYHAQMAQDGGRAHFSPANNLKLHVYLQFPHTEEHNNVY